MSVELNHTNTALFGQSDGGFEPLEIGFAILLLVVIVQQYLLFTRASESNKLVKHQQQQPEATQTKSCSVETSDRKVLGTKKQGDVVLVGCGPGDADLLTVAALKAIQSADLVITDRLVSPSITSLIPKTTTVKVSKKYKGRAQAAQQELHDWILEGAKEGLTVVRLKGGDSFVYGRGREEVQALLSSGFPVRVIPGISSVLAAPLAAGVPVTSRHVADRLVILSGHCKKPDVADVASQQIDSVACVRDTQDGNNKTGPSNSLKTTHLKIPLYEPGTTLVFLMSVGTLASVQQQLLKVANTPKEVPVAFIEKATTPEQRVTIGTVGSMLDTALEAKVASPATIVVGDVVTCIAHGEAKPKAVTEYVPGGVLYSCK